MEDSCLVASMAGVALMEGLFSPGVLPPSGPPQSAVKRTTASQQFAFEGGRPTWLQAAQHGNSHVILNPLVPAFGNRHPWKFLWLKFHMNAEIGMKEFHKKDFYFNTT